MEPEGVKLGLKEIAQRMMPILNDFEKMYSRSAKYRGLSDQAVEFIIQNGLPEWLRFYDEEFPAAFLNFELKSFGLSKEDISFNPSKEQPPGMPDLLMKMLTLKPEEIKPTVAMDQAFAIEIMLRYVAFTNNVICLFHYGVSITKLLPKARAGNDQALFTVLKVDKAVLSAEWALKRIREAQFRKDAIFLKNLGRAISMSPGVGRFRHLKALSLLMVLWPFGLKEKTSGEILDFLEEMGVYGSKHGTFDPLSLSRLMNRIGLRKLRKLASKIE